MLEPLTLTLHVPVRADRYILTCVHGLKSPSEHFDICRYISFSTSSTRSGFAQRMSHVRSTNNSSRHFYFNRLPRLWNSLPPINLEQSIPTIKNHLFMTILHRILYPQTLVPFIYFAPALVVLASLLHLGFNTLIFVFYFCMFG